MSDRTLVLRRSYPDVTPDEMFEAWTAPDLVAEWYGPEGFTNDIEFMEARAGGGYRLIMNAPDGQKFALRGTFRAVERPTKVSFTWIWEEAPPGADPQETLVTVDIRAAGSATEIVLTHEDFRDTAQRDMHVEGWSGSLDKLGRFLARR